MSSLEAGQTLINELVKQLERPDQNEQEGRDFIHRLVSQLKEAELSRNQSKNSGIEPVESWNTVFDNSDQWRLDTMLSCIHALTPLGFWFTGESVYPESEKNSFARHIWGMQIAGESHAIFHCEDRYVALLIVLDAHNTYPLHAHWIEELYVMISGNGQWSHDGEEWQTLPPGSSFYNRSNQPHSFRTIDEPIITMGLYLPPIDWSSEIL